MESINTTNTSELLDKLTRLEDQVSTLSSQLELNKILIGQLKQSVSDRDLQISEMEAKLAIAQHSLQKTAAERIDQCREQIKKGIDEKLVIPVLTQIRKYIKVIEDLIAESKAFIGNKKTQLQEGLNTVSDSMQQMPGYAMDYVEINAIAPAKSLVNKAWQSADNTYKAGKDWLEQELLKPGQQMVNRVVFLARELPLDAKLIVQTRVVDPAFIYIEKLPGLINEVWSRILAWLQHLNKKLRYLIQHCVDFIEEHIKKSQFWDGKHRMQAA